MDDKLIVSIIVSIVALICWILTLASHLKNTQMDAIERIVWTIVLCSLNIVGVFFYWWLVSTDSDTTFGVKSDEELKEYFNSKHQPNTEKTNNL